MKRPCLCLSLSLGVCRWKFHSLLGGCEIQAGLHVQWNVAFFGQHDMKGSLKWMGAFWVSIAGASWNSVWQAF